MRPQRFNPNNSTPVPNNTRMRCLRTSLTGDFHTCALLANRSLICFGNNERGACKPPEDLGQVASVSAALSATCALTVAGDVRCWGGEEYFPRPLDPNNPWGPRANYSVVPIKHVPAFERGTVVSVSAAIDYGCEVLANKTAVCWGGDNETDSTGIGYAKVPEDLSGRVVAVATGQSSTCVITTDGAAECWGGLIIAEDGTHGPRLRSPPGLPPLKKIARPGYSHVCAVDVNDAAHCWLNDYPFVSAEQAFGSIGPGLGPVRDLTVGYNYVCAVLASGAVLCDGQSVLTSSFPPVSVPKDFAAPGAALAVDAGVMHTCVIAPTR